ncbi:hypothetical protein StoSoilB5_19300 [Arthrobacter sp. StoSoilB5]|nr:hypothetical protein StoSoilB5_19300 [Arthrobacter sp. StoSoilB5]
MTSGPASAVAPSWFEPPVLQEARLSARAPVATMEMNFFMLSLFIVSTTVVGDRVRFRLELQLLCCAMRTSRRKFCTDGNVPVV